MKYQNYYVQSVSIFAVQSVSNLCRDRTLVFCGPQNLPLFEKPPRGLAKPNLRMDLDPTKLLLDLYATLNLSNFPARLSFETNNQQQFLTLSVKIDKNSRSFVPKKRKSPSAQRRSRARASKFREKTAGVVAVSTAATAVVSTATAATADQTISSQAQSTSNSAHEERAATPPRGIKRRRVISPAAPSVLAPISPIGPPAVGC